MNEWRETWRRPDYSQPPEGRFVIVYLKNGYVRNAFIKEGHYMSSTKDDAYELEVEGWIPFPRKKKRLLINDDLPADVVVPYLAADLKKANKRIAYLESLLEDANMRKGEDYF